MLQAYKYGILTILRNKSQLFWTALFPIILGTLFHFAFEGIMDMGDFNPIPVAIVEMEDNPQLTASFKEMMTELSTGDDALVTPYHVTLDEATEKLETGAVEGIFQLAEELTLAVPGSGINQSILQSIANSFIQMNHTFGNIATENPEGLEQAIASLYEDLQINQEIILGRSEVHLLTYYFYVLLAMVCFMASDIGFLKAVNIQADASDLGVRRAISPTKKFMLIVSDFLAGVTAHFSITLMSVVYFVFILGVDFGDQLGMVMLAVFVACLAGASFGTLFATVFKGNVEFRQGILSSVNMFLYILGGLMLVQIRIAVREIAPLLDRINPITMIGDTFYSLAVYDDYSRFFSLIGSLLIFTLLCCLMSATFLRRKRYASL